MSPARKIRNPSLIAYGTLTVLLSMALFVIGSIMTNPLYEELGYLMSEVFTLLCLLLASGYTFLTMSDRGSPHQSQTFGLALFASVLCWLVLWIQQPLSDSDRVLLSLVALHGLFWGARCVAISQQSGALSPRSITCLLIGAAACSAGIILATQSAITKLVAVTTAGCYMLCLGLQLFVVSLLLNRQTVQAPVTGS